VVGINTLAFAATGTPGLNFALAASELSQLLQNRFGVKPSPVAPASPIQTSAPAGASTAPLATATLSIASTPAGAEIELDGVFVGSTPEDLPLTAGQHVIKISKKGFKDYQRTLQVLGGGTQRLSAQLEQQ
jgi:hypothetical protein